MALSSASTSSKPRAVLTKELVVEIYGLRVKAARPTATSVARRIGVNEKTIRDIWSGRTWHKETMNLDLAQHPKKSSKTGRPQWRKDIPPQRRKSANLATQAAATLTATRTEQKSAKSEYVSGDIGHLKSIFETDPLMIGCAEQSNPSMVSTKLVLTETPQGQPQHMLIRSSPQNNTYSQITDKFIQHFHPNVLPLSPKHLPAILLPTSTTRMSIFQDSLVALPESLRPLSTCSHLCPPGFLASGAFQSFTALPLLLSPSASALIPANSQAAVLPAPPFRGGWSPAAPRAGWHSFASYTA